MCSIIDAERHEKLASLHEKSGESRQAYEQYLEASSIYLLQSELTKTESLTKRANDCYQKGQKGIGKKSVILSKSQLAQKTLKELETFRDSNNDFLSHIKHHGEK